MNERERNLERSNTLFKAVLNVEIEKELLEWKGPILIGHYPNKLNILLHVAQEARFGLEIQVQDRRIIGGKTPFISNEVKRYLVPGTRETAIFKLPDAEERKKKHRRFIRVSASGNDLNLASSGICEAIFPRQDVVSLTVK